MMATMNEKMEAANVLLEAEADVNLQTNDVSDNFSILYCKQFFVQVLCMQIMYYHTCSNYSNILIARMESLSILFPS